MATQLIAKDPDHQKSSRSGLGALECSLSLGMEDRAWSWDAGFRWAKVQESRQRGQGWSPLLTLACWSSRSLKPLRVQTRWAGTLPHATGRTDWPWKDTSWRETCHRKDDVLSRSPGMPWHGFHRFPTSFKTTANGSKRQDPDGNAWVQRVLQIFLWTSHKQMARGCDVQGMSQEQ